MSQSLQRISVAERDDVFLIRHFLAAEECASHIAMSEDHGYELAMINTAAGQRVATHVRNNDRVIWDDPALAETWWSRAHDLVPPTFGRWRACGINERFRFYRYQPGQRFALHRDGSYERASGECSWLTLMVYLNDGYGGGRTRFDLPGEADIVAVTPEAGMALLFEHDRLHEGEAVTSGTKYVLRTDVMYRRA